MDSPRKRSGRWSATRFAGTRRVQLDHGEEAKRIGIRERMIACKTKEYGMGREVRQTAVSSDQPDTDEQSKSTQARPARQ
jgi:hypothetical protein